jgi:tetratricopeptide (TPR) repeat protein
MELAPESLLERLAEAIDARVLLIREDAPDAYRFVHSIFQDVLRDELAPQRRAVLHAKVGTILEHLYSHELDSYAADLAHHFSEAVAAGFASQAVEYCLRAGRVAVSQSAWDEACSHLHRAIDFVDLLPADAPERSPILVGRVWEELGDIYSIAVDADGALEAYQQAARRVPPEEGLWQARLREKVASQHRNRERYDEAMRCLAEAEALLGPPTKDAEVPWWDTWINVQRERGWLYFHQGRLEDLYGLVGQVEKTAGMHGGARARAHFDRLRTLAEWTRQRFLSNSEVLRLAEECAKNFREAGSAGDLLWAERVLAEAQLWSPEKRGSAYGQLVCYRELAERTRSVWHQLAALWFLQVWHRLRGEVDAVHDHALATLLLMTDPPGLWTAFGGEAKGHLSWVAWRVGDLDEAQTLSTEAFREIEEAGYSAFEWQARWTLLGLGLLGEHWDEASRQIEALLDQSQQKMPGDLEECLQRLVEEREQNQPPTSETVEALTTTARAYGYL